MTDTSTPTTDTCDEQITLAASTDCLQQFNIQNATINVHQHCGCCDNNSDCTCQGGSGNNNQGTDSGSGSGTTPATPLAEFFYVQEDTALTKRYKFTAVTLDTEQNIFAAGMSYNAGVSTVFIYKMDKMGAQLASTEIEVSDFNVTDAAVHIKYGSNGFIYLFAGAIGKVLLLKLNSDLTVDTSVTSEDSYIDIQKMMLDGEDNIYLSGSSYDSAHIPMVLKFTADLALSDRKVVVDYPEAYAHDIIQTTDGNIVFLYEMYDESDGNYHILVLKTDTSLNILKLCKLLRAEYTANNKNLSAVSIVESEDESLLLMTIVDGNRDAGNAALLKLNKDLEYQGVINRPIPRITKYDSIIRLEDNSYVITADQVLLRLDENLNYVSHLNYVGQVYDIEHDSLGRLVTVGGNGLYTAAAIVLPDTLELSQQALESIYINQYTVPAVISVGSYITEAITVTLASNLAATPGVPQLSMASPGTDYSLSKINA